MEFLVVALLGGFFAFNAVATPDRAAKTAEKSLRAQFPGAGVNVEIDGKRGRNVLAGRFKRIRIELSDLTLTTLPITGSVSSTKALAASPVSPKLIATDASSTTVSSTKRKRVKLGRAETVELSIRRFTLGTLKISAADFLLRDVQYDLNALKKQSQMRIVRCGAATMKLQLSAADLTPLVTSRLTEVSNPNLQLRDNQIVFSGERPIVGFVAPFQLTGTVAGAGDALSLNDVKFTVSGLPVPPALVKTQVGNLNPVYRFDLGEAPFQVQIQNVTAQNDVLSIDANLPFLEARQ
jgi:hypothetical protein